jgi:hypothetical protein
MGQVLLNHLGGGAGGIEHFFEQFTGPVTAWWKVLGSPELTIEVPRKLIDGLHVEVGSRSIPKLEAQRDEESARTTRVTQEYETPAVTRQETAVALNSD